MKVYELMDKLSKMPAGAEIVASSTMSVAELTNIGDIDVIDGIAHYSVKKEVVNAIAEGRGERICLYT
jgi:hypothetical protein